MGWGGGMMATKRHKAKKRNGAKMKRSLRGQGEGTSFVWWFLFCEGATKRKLFKLSHDSN